MDIIKDVIFQGNEIEIDEMTLINKNEQLVLLWKIIFNDSFFWITFVNVTRFRIGEVSIPLIIEGFEVIDHSRDAWENDSTYEIRDFENDRIHFFANVMK